MNNFLTILLHTYLSKLKTKSFIATTLITVVIVAGLANLSGIIDYFNKDDEERVAVIDETGVLLTPLQEQMDALNNKITLIEY
ncbi:hypothetical protein OSK38_27025, partial [Escherichia coli]|nr:hypothetical protein [Escherichia coli]